MAKVARIPLEIRQGGTFSKVLRWGQPRLAYRKIAAATADAPCMVTTTAPHDLPDGWPYRIANAKGMLELNSPTPSDGEPPVHYLAAVLSPTALELNGVDSSAFKQYTGGGIISYHMPVDLDAFEGARMQVRADIKSAAVLLELNTDNGGIVLDNTAKEIILQQSATITAGIDWLSAVYDLEVYTASGIVTPVAYGPVKVTREVSR